MTAPPATDVLPKLVCGGCRTCCLGDTITLEPGENFYAYKTISVNGRAQLQKGEDGNCVYLGETGCTIYDRQPRMCRALDCRKYAQLFEAQPERRAERWANPLRRPVIEEGRLRLAAGRGV